MDIEKKAFWVLFASVFIAMSGLGIIAPLMPIYAKSLGVTGIWLGVVFAAFSISRTMFMPLIGKLSDKKGKKGFIVTGLSLYSVLSIMYTLAGGFLSLTAVRFVQGISSAMVIPIAMAYIGETSPKGKEGSYMGLFSMSLFLGMGAGPFIGGTLSDAFGIKFAFYTMGALTSLSLLTTILYLPGLEPKCRKKEPMSMRKMLKNNTVKGIFIFRVVNSMGRGSISSFLPLLANRLHLSSTEIGIIISTNILVAGALQGIFGKVADRYNKIGLIIAGSVVGIVSYMLIPLAKTFWQFTALSLAIGVAGAISIPSASAIVVKLGRGFGMGSMMGLFNTAISIGMILGPLTAGVVMQLWNVNSIFYVTGMATAISVVLFYYYTQKEEDRSIFVREKLAP